MSNFESREVGEAVRLSIEGFSKSYGTEVRPLHTSPLRSQDLQNTADASSFSQTQHPGRPRLSPKP